MNNREVVITGVGLTAPLGSSVKENWNNVKAMKSGIVHVPAEGLPDFLQYAGRTDRHELPEEISPRQEGQMKFLNRGAVLGFCSAWEAISSSIEKISDISPGRRALYIAAGDFTKIGSQFMYPAMRDSVDDHWQNTDQQKLNISMLNKVNPFFLLESLNNNLFSFLSAFIEFMGPNTSLASLSPCGGNAMELAYRSIKQGNADIALAVGYGSWINEIIIYELEGLGILSKCKSGAGSYKPFDRNRDGFITGEGGAAVLLEDADKAAARGARVYGKIRGFGNCTESDAENKMGVPDEVSKRNMVSTLREADCSTDDLAFIIPHGSGTRKGDRSELRSVKHVIDTDGSNIPLCGLKPYTGHMGAASDIAEVIMGINAVNDKTVPATLNFEKTEKEFMDLKISGSPQSCEKNRFLSVSYGVGGQSSSVIVEVS